MMVHHFGWSQLSGLHQELKDEYQPEDFALSELRDAAPMLTPVDINTRIDMVTLCHRYGRFSNDITRLALSKPSHQKINEGTCALIVYVLTTWLHHASH